MMKPLTLTWLNFTQFLETPSVSGTEVEEYWMDVRFLPEWFESIYMEWTVPDEWKPFNPKFQIFISENEVGPWREVTQNQIDTPFYNITGTMNTSKTYREFFRVQAHLSNGKVYQTHVITVGRHMPRWQFKRWVEVNRREWILLDKFTGVESVIFRRRTFGTRCSHCWDAKNEKILREHCPQCYGTSYEGGYYQGISVLMQYDTATNTQHLQYFGKYEPNLMTSWTISYPTIQPHDIILRTNDYKIFRVEGVQNTEILTTQTRQMIQIQELAKNHIEHSLVKRGNWEKLKMRPRHTHH